MDICRIGAGEGGVLAASAAAGATIPDVITRLYADGCDPKHTPATTAWPAIRHLTIAQLRSAFGVDAVPVGLDASIAHAYPGLTVTFRTG